MEKNTQISGHSGGGHLVLVCSEHHRPRPLLTVNKLRQQHRWAWLSQIFLRCVGADLDLIMSVQHFAGIDPDRSRFDYEHNHYHEPPHPALWLVSEWSASNVIRQRARSRVSLYLVYSAVRCWRRAAIGCRWRQCFTAIGCRGCVSLFGHLRLHLGYHLLHLPQLQQTEYTQTHTQSKGDWTSE